MDTLGDCEARKPVSVWSCHLTLEVRAHTENLLLSAKNLTMLLSFFRPQFETHSNERFIGFYFPSQRTLIGC